MEYAQMIRNGQQEVKDYIAKESCGVKLREDLIERNYKELVAGGRALVDEDSRYSLAFDRHLPSQLQPGSAGIVIIRQSASSGDIVVRWHFHIIAKERSDELSVRVHREGRITKAGDPDGLNIGTESIEFATVAEAFKAFFFDIALIDNRDDRARVPAYTAPFAIHMAS